jgi:molybdate transport repressor ModE-like protein
MRRDNKPAFSLTVSPQNFQTNEHQTWEAAMPNKQLRCQVSVRIFGEEKCFGPGVADLLERVDRLKSLRKATIEMDMAYSKAWKIVKVAESNLGFQLLKSVTGGKGGGGAELTEDAQRFLKAYRQFEESVRSYADEAFVEIMGG